MKKFRKLLKNIKRKVNKMDRDFKYNHAAKKITKKKLAYGLNKSRRDENVVVSLTSYGKRFDSVYLTIRSIFNQTYKADKVILYIASNDVARIPSKLEDLKNYGLEIRSENTDLKPHNKYFYAIHDFPNALIVTIDDDMLYPSDLLENLVKMHQMYPKSVIASRVHEILVDKNNELLPYRKWGWEIDAIPDDPSFKYLATGVGGVLYPPNSLAPELLNKDLIQMLALKADDLWLKAAELKANTPVKMAAGYMWKRTYEEPYAESNALSNSNVKDDKNDEIIKNILDYYDLPSCFFRGDMN